jgi:RHS repeat-associated protein
VGKGWSLQTGYVALNKITDDPTNSRYYSLVFNGQSFDLMRGECLPGTACTAGDPTQWAWHPTDESFLRARVVLNPQASTSTRGWYSQGAAQPRYIWRVWTKDGTLYEFAEDTFWGWNFCPARTGYMEANKWYLSSVTDTHNNTISYAYGRATQAVSSACNTTAMNGINDYAIWPTTITWATNRYRVTFVTQARTFDTLAPVHGGAELGYAPQETLRLTQIQVATNTSADPINNPTWQLDRAYNLTYYAQSQSLTSDASVPSGSVWNAEGTPKLTLQQIQQIGSDGSAALPPISFTYGTTRGTAVVPNGNWNRLTQVNNGHGGIATFAYDSVANAPDVGAASGLFRNNRRLTSKTLNDGMGHTYTWTYDYAAPATNSLGSNQPNRVGMGPNPYTNSASVYYSEFVNASQVDLNRALLIHPRYTEFRGHKRVIETDPNGNQTDHAFLQGDTGVNPTATTNILNDPTFQALRKQEFLKGRESDTIRYTGTVTTGQKLSSVHHDFTVDFYDSGQDVVNGLWRAFSYERAQVEQTYEGGPSPLTKTTNYFYNPVGHQSDGFQYGNLTEVDELDPNGAVYRRTFHDYTVLSTTTSYLADREIASYTKDGATPNANWLALRLNLYDDGSYGATGTKGELTRTCAVANISLTSLSANLPASLTCTDTHYHYTTYGAVQYTSTYSDTSAATWNGGFSGSFAGRSDNTAPARTTSNSYDATFPERLTQVTQPAGAGSVALIETATYSPTLGVLMSVTDPNGNATLARYDLFGRQVKLIKPGDSETYPTVAGAYYDWNVPFRYQALQRTSPTGNPANITYSVQRSFYDGLGRVIQTKQESGVNGQGYGNQMIVVDTRYDGLGQVTAQSQPWYSNTGPSNTDPNFYLYVQPTSTLTNATTTTYDGLGRPRVVTAPDTSATTMSYSLDLTHQVRVAATIDARNHKTDHGSDVFGRLARVVEYSGNNGSEGAYSAYATTTYAYNPLDLLTGVTDQNGNQTTVTYDSLGRKIALTDPDMGAWQYQYDPNGNLTQQTDARGWPLTFSYDVRDRLTRLDYAAGGLSSASYTYDETSQTNGKGQRTSMRLVARGDGANAVATTWAYDARGQASRSDTTRWIGGTYTVQYTYDSADRPSQVTYPAFAGPGGVAETVTYAYDPAGRPTSLCSTATDVPGANHCYVSGAGYTALAQPAARSLGNGASETWSYDAVMARLSTHQVSGSQSTLYNRSYGYDLVGNVTSITNNLSGGEQQTFAYDHRDRLTDWSINNVPAEHDTYDALGNLTSKAGVSYSYGPTNTGPHQARTVGGQSYSYDQNGNLTSDGTRSYTLGPLNLPEVITWAGHEEDYVYAPDGQRLYRSHNGVSTIYLDDGLVEVDYPNYTSRTYYRFNGQVIAQASKANGGSRTLTWLHGDQLGSTSLLTASSGLQSGPTQEFDPWGAVRSGRLTATALNYTGQKLDGNVTDGSGTGLLYYGARYYNPAIGRFVSADSIVPGAAMGAGGALGTVGAAQNSKLSVDFHEPGFLSGLNGETAFTQQHGFWFQLNSDERSKANVPWGPATPQALNRYSYVLNNPLRYIDPTGHANADGGGGDDAGDSSEQPEFMPTKELVHLTDPEVDEWAEEEGFPKGEYLGRAIKEKQGGGKVDLYYNPDNGQIYVVPKGGKTGTIADGWIYPHYKSTAGNEHSATIAPPKVPGWVPFIILAGGAALIFAGGGGGGFQKVW